jgi:hypothetical protein
MSDLPLDALSAWCDTHVRDFRGPVTATKFKGGQSNPTYRLDAASGTYVLRRKPFGTLLPGRTRWIGSSRVDGLARARRAGGATAGAAATTR